MTNMSNNHNANTLSKKQISTIAESLRLTHFSKFEIECFLGLYKAASSKGKMDRNRFRDFLHREFAMTDDMLLDRVFKAFDQDNDGLVGPSEWVEGLSIILRGNIEEKIQFCFDVYDLNSDGYISREEMFHMLKNSLVKPTSDEDPDEGIKDLVEVCIKKMDDDQDHRLSFKDFHAAVLREPLLIECFGPCLPGDKDIKGFLDKLSVNSK